jgi:uncharacterized protein YecE (DUF72 family)
MTNSLARWTGSVKPEARRRVGPVSGDVPSNEEYLRWLVDSLAQTHVVVEFRHTRWLTDQTMDFLRELKAGYCIVDMPQVRNLPSRRLEVTSSVAYVRFHGQNTAMWEAKASRNERYDYEYTEEELQGWVEPIQNVSKVAEQTYVLFNNHYRGKAAKNAQMLQALLKQQSQGPLPRDAIT